MIAFQDPTITELVGIALTLFQIWLACRRHT
jgi:hypothetical protein